MTPPNGVETHWDVHGLRLAGLSWGSPEARPLLCLHGWLDNAASFAVLAPLLQGSHVVAPDLTGHGKSARRSADATYQICSQVFEGFRQASLEQSARWDQRTPKKTAKPKPPSPPNTPPPRRSTESPTLPHTHQ